MIEKSQKGYMTSFLLKKAEGVFYSAFVGLPDMLGFYDIKLSQTLKSSAKAENERVFWPF